MTTNEVQVMIHNKASICCTMLSQNRTRIRLPSFCFGQVLQVPKLTLKFSGTRVDSEKGHLVLIGIVSRICLNCYRVIPGSGSTWWKAQVNVPWWSLKFWGTTAGAPEWLPTESGQTQWGLQAVAQHHHCWPCAGPEGGTLPYNLHHTPQNFPSPRGPFILCPRQMWATCIFL